MFRWIEQLGRQFRELVEAETSHAMQRLRQLGLIVGSMIALCVLAGIAAAGLLAGVVLLLAPEIGLGWSLLLVSSAVLLLMCLAIWWTYSYAGFDQNIKQAKQEAKSAEREIKDLVTPGDSSSSNIPEPAQHSHSTPSTVQKITNVVAEHPVEIASAVFVGVALLGAKRSLRMVRSAVATASAGLAAYRTLSSLNDAVRSCTPKESATHHNGHSIRSKRSESDNGLHRKSTPSGISL